MTTQHTTGPWELRQSSRDYWFIDHKQGGEGYTLTKLADWTSEADARLIAAAPDLLAVLQQANAWVCQYHGVNGHDAASRQMSNVIRAAIAKATGGAE